MSTREQLEVQQYELARRWPDCWRRWKEEVRKGPQYTAGELHLRWRWYLGGWIQARHEARLDVYPEDARRARASR